MKETEIKTDYIMVEREKYESLLVNKGKNEAYYDMLSTVIKNLTDSYFKNIK